MHLQQLQWWNQLIQGDQASFNQLFDHYWEPLFQYAYKITQSQQDSEEIVQDLFIHIWQKHSELAPVQSVNAYLFVALKNRLLNHLSRKKITMQPVDALRNNASGYTSETLFENREQEKIIRRLSGNLPEKMRYVYLRHQLEGRTIREIAEETDSSEQTIRNQLNTALKKLSIAYKGIISIVLCCLILPNC